MNPPRRRFGRWHPAIVGAATIGVALVALLWAFDWNWFRPRLEHYLAEKSQRSVRIGDLHLSLSAAFDPTLRLRGVRIENAPWADARPFIDAGELRATFLLSSLIDKRPVISRLVVIDADIDLERQVDGLRNWRLIHPDDRGPTRVRLMSIEAIRSKIRFAHRALEIDVQTAAGIEYDHIKPLRPTALDTGLADADHVLCRRPRLLLPVNIDIQTASDTGKLVCSGGTAGISGDE